MKISTKILLSSFLSIILVIATSITLTFFNNKNLKDEFIREHKVSVYEKMQDELKVITEIGYQILESTHKNQMKMGNTFEYMMEVITKRFADESVNLKENLQVLYGNVTKVRDSNQRIIDDFNATGVKVSGLVKEIQTISSISSENARSVEEIASASEHLNRMTEDLQNKLQEFRT